MTLLQITHIFRTSQRIGDTHQIKREKKSNLNTVQTGDNLINTEWKFDRRKEKNTHTELVHSSRTEQHTSCGLSSFSGIQ